MTGKDRTLLEMLSLAAKAISMKPVDVKKKLSNGTRKELAQSLKVVRLLPEVSDAWLASGATNLQHSSVLTSGSVLMPPFSLKQTLEIAFAKNPDEVVTFSLRHARIRI